MSKDRAPRRFYDPRYSVISYLGSPAKYQDSNQWVLKLIALAQAKADGGNGWVWLGGAGRLSRGFTFMAA